MPIKPINNNLLASATIVCADAADWLAEQPPQSIDLIMTSPPYAEQRMATYGGIPADEYVAWWLGIAEHMARALKPTGSLVVNIKEHCHEGERHTYVYEMVLAMRQQGWLWRDEMVWHKTNPLPYMHSTKLRDGWERLYHFSRQRDIIFNADAIRVPCADTTARRVSNLTELDRTKRQSATGSGMVVGGLSQVAVERGVVPPNVISGGLVGHDVGHPAVYPPYIPEFFIKLMTNEGDVVCDPFAGSGTTLRAALRLGRHAIGCDIHPDYVQEMTA